MTAARPLPLLVAPAMTAALLVSACSGGSGTLDFDSTTTSIVPIGAAPTATESRSTAPEATEPEPTSDAAGAGEIVIGAGSARPLDRRLFGTNVPAWLGPQRLADPALRAATVALGTTLLRFPGGTWGNHYHWLAGIAE